MPIIQLPPTPQPANNPRDFAIVVGINHYRTGIDALNGAVNDCNLFCYWLTQPDMGGLDSGNITLLHSVENVHEPIRGQIEDRLVDFFDAADQKGIPCGRRLYLFLAGHGLTPPPPDTSGCALVMADARPNLLRGLLGFKAANAMRLTGLFEEVVLIMDCCAQVAGPAELECSLPHYGDPALNARPYLHIQAAKWNATTSERLLNDPFDSAKQSQQGVLTNALLRGLTTAIEVTGQVTPESLKRFLQASEASDCVVEFANGGNGTVMTFGRATGVPVEVNLNEWPLYQIREGNNFSVVVPPRNSPSVRLAPGQYLFDAIDAQGGITRSVPVSVREGGISVHL